MAGLAISVFALGGAAPGFAQTPSPAGGAALTAKPADKPVADKPTADKPAKSKRPTLNDNKAISSNVTVNLLNLLVKQGVIKDDQAKALIKQAEDEAYVARQAAKDANKKADDAGKTAAVAAAAASPPGTKHVTYVPEIVKRQLREDIKREVMAKAEAENWASPGKYPEWASRIHVYGDMRLRYQGAFFARGNDQANAINFPAINLGNPYDVSQSNPAFPPTYDTTANRNVFRIRARPGIEIDLSNGLYSNIRLGTGDNFGPVSTNATFGSNGGNFSKYAVYLDRGFVGYSGFDDNLNIYAGRFDNPFYRSVEHMWYEDLGFDGLAVKAKREVRPGYTSFATAGAFPIFNSDLNAGINLAGPTGQPTKSESHDKFLFAGQLGMIGQVRPDVTMRGAVAFYDFENTEGQLSQPCFVFSTADACSTDLYRQFFGQKGNTYTPIRNIIAGAYNNFGTTNQFQYFGLAGAYRPLVLDGAVDFSRYDPLHVVLSGEYINNTAFNRARMEQLAINNRAGTTDGSRGSYDGGNQGWMAQLTVGKPQMLHRWDWNVFGGYKYMESDATIDAFTDPNFGLGGTNLKGYFVGARLGVGENVWAELRYMGANNISGIPYGVDVVQLDLNGKF